VSRQREKSIASHDGLFPGTAEMAERMRAVDWSLTAVGPIEGWPHSVRAIIRMMLTTRYAMWMGWGPELNFFYNDAYAHMTLGAKHPWALGRPASEVWSEIWSDVGPRIDHVLATGEATWDEGLLLFLERSGFPEETYHTFSYSPLHDDDGRVGGMFCVVTEETNRLIGERRLGLLREFGTRLAASQTTHDVWEAVERSASTDARDLPFTMTYLVGDNETTATLAASSNVRAGDPVALESLPIDNSKWPIRAVVEGATPRPRVVDLDGTVAWPNGPWPKPPTRAVVLPIAQQAQTRPAGVFIAGLNPYRPFDAEYESFITLYVSQLAAGLANAQAYAAERRRAEALAQIDRAKTTFFSNVSHEFRTPLTLMQAPVEDLLRSSDLPPAHRDQLALVHRNALRLQKLVNTLLDFSRIEAGRVQPIFEPTDLAELTATLADAFRSATEAAGLALVVDCQPIGELVYVDRDMWEKVVLNLVSNAFKFTLSGEIRIVLRRVDDTAVLTVQDSGSGIPPQELPFVFDRFHRVAGTRGRTHEGTGIGLALVHELVKLHAGTVVAQSELDRGSRFTVAVPLGTAHLSVEARDREPVAASTGLGRNAFVEEAMRWLPGFESTDDPGLAGDAAAAVQIGRGPALACRERILLADDNADMREYVRRLLLPAWEVEIVTNGREALSAAIERPPDLVITDVMMPELDGFELLRQLREHPSTRDVPVMMLSARAGEESRVEGLQAGADDYVIKPFSARELVARVETQLLRGRVRSIEQTQRRRLLDIFAQAPTAIAILHGPEHVFEMANPWYLELVDGRDLIGKPVRDALPEVVSQGIVDLLDEVYATGQPHVGRALPVVVNRADATPEQRYFDVVYQPMFDRHGVVQGIAAVVYDVSELVRARENAEIANRAKDEFLAMLGHELRNPLAPILTALQLLKLRGIDAGERERNVIERQVKHVVNLVDDLLDVSRITRGKLQLQRRPVEIVEAVAKAIETASPLLEQQRHTLVVDVQRSGLTVNADLDRLAQVISNLLTNAAKYTEPGGRITVTGQRERDAVVLRVADNGIGIAADMLPRIFDSFVQDRQALDRARGGLGLGLTIVKSLVSLHDGSVTAESGGRGHGASFTVRLPLEVERVPDQAGRTVFGPAVVATGVAKRVLVVDDNEDAASMLASGLSTYGHDVRTAPDGPTALDLAELWQPDVAVLDLGLPVMDGYELARRLSEQGETGTRLIAVTGYGQEQDRRRSADAGFDAHLVKPIDIEALRTLIDQKPASG
jgi:signal transduction histidine kinase/response regulator RpfG family c-di-GMP phosphodiesterase